MVIILPMSQALPPMFDRKEQVCLFILSEQSIHSIEVSQLNVTSTESVAACACQNGLAILLSKDRFPLKLRKTNVLGTCSWHSLFVFFPRGSCTADQGIKQQTGCPRNTIYPIRWQRRVKVLQKNKQSYSQFAWLLQES